MIENQPDMLAIRSLGTRWLGVLAAALLAASALGACSAEPAAQTAAGTPVSGADQAPSTIAESEGFLDSSTLHDISFAFDEDDYDAMIDTYAATGEKEWIVADVTIDGITYTQAGIRLKGNSSLGGLQTGQDGGPGGDASADAPQDLPWLIRLDKFVDGQNYEGIFDLVIRSNTSETSLNEAVSLELLDLAGLASQEAAYAAFSVNGAEEALRLVIEHPDDVWLDGAFADPGVLYKAEATGDYSYRGESPDAYDEVFDLEAGADNGDLAPLIEFLDFINNADDDAFNTELAERLDVDAFATYLAVQELIANADDIDGRGNNSYLFYDTETEMVTVVPWDHNLAFGTSPGDGGFRDAGGQGDFSPPQRFDPGGVPGTADGALSGDFETLQQDPGAEGLAPPARPNVGDNVAPGGARGFPAGPGDASNILVARFLANETWQALYEQKLDDLRASLYESGVAGDVLDSWADLLRSEAGGLVDSSTVTEEADSIARFLA